MIAEMQRRAHEREIKKPLSDVGDSPSGSESEKKSWRWPLSSGSEISAINVELIRTLHHDLRFFARASYQS
jgi:hypothetical protein